MSSKTEIVREEIRKYLKETNGRVRQVDLTNYILGNSHVATPGIIRGIFNGVQGIGGRYRHIPNVAFAKEEGKVFYYYEENNFSEDSTMNRLSQKVAEFEAELKKDDLLKVSFLDILPEERRHYLEFIEKFEELRDIFTTKDQ